MPDVRVLTGQRVILRAPRLDDAEELFAAGCRLLISRHGLGDVDASSVDVRTTRDRKHPP